MSSEIVKKEILRALAEVRRTKPLVHCITNYVTVNDCANALLASGASPVMADDIAEVEDITAISGALVINIGTLNERTIRSMFAAGKKAASLGKPVILDPVGAGASRFRTETALALMKEIPFAVIRGNASEIKTLHAGSGTTKGVDADEKDTGADGFDFLVKTARELSLSTGAVVAITGATDIATDGTRVFAVRNGDPAMARITGSGCMLSAVTGGFCAVFPGAVLEAVVASLCTMGLSGEIAASRVRREKSGTGSFRTLFIDALSRMDGNTLSRGMKIDALV